MPPTRISLRAGKSADFRSALIRGIYAAQRETFAVPEDALFAVIHEHDEAGFALGHHDRGTARDADLVLIQITAKATRATDQKRPSTTRSSNGSGAIPECDRAMCS